MIMGKPRMGGVVNDNLRIEDGTHSSTMDDYWHQKYRSSAVRT